jgi:exodeoxyribonuclease VII large subunit
VESPSESAAVTGSELRKTQLPRFSVASLNRAVATLLERGFAPRFLLDATVGRPQLKKGHLWMSLMDEEASISAVVWASQLPRLSYRPEEGDGVVVVGKLNFWASRASLVVQILDLRPSLTSVLRRFERVRVELAAEGLFDSERKRSLPETPRRIALLTSVPSSALADMLRTAAERWPATEVVVVPIPVQGQVEEQICGALHAVNSRQATLNLDALVLARGGGSREDLAVFDGADLARCIAAAPCPVVCGIGHEDDVTIADLVADYRAATPTAAMVALLPDRALALPSLLQQQCHLRQLITMRLQAEQQKLGRMLERLQQLHPLFAVRQRRKELQHAQKLLQVLSPDHILKRGFSVLRGPNGDLVHSIKELSTGKPICITLADGQADAVIHQLRPLRQSQLDHPPHQKHHDKSQSQS